MVLDIPDTGNALLAITSAQSVAEVCYGRPVFAAVLGTVGLAGFIRGNQTLVKGLEYMQSRGISPTNPTHERDKPGPITSCLERLRGIGYAIAASGFVNELDATAYRNTVLMFSYMGVAFAGIGLTVLGDALYPDEANQLKVKGLHKEQISPTEGLQ